MEKIYKVQLGVINRDLLTYDSKQIKNLFNNKFFSDDYKYLYKEIGTIFTLLKDNNVAEEILTKIKFNYYFFDNKDVLSNNYFLNFLDNGAIILSGTPLETKDDYLSFKNYIESNLDIVLLKGKLNWAKENGKIDMNILKNKLYSKRKSK